MLKQTGGLWGHLPVEWTRQASPRLEPLADLIDDRRWIIRLVLCRETLPLIEHYLLLSICALSLPWFRNRRDGLCPPASFDDLLSGLPLRIQLPMPERAFIG